MNSDKWLACGAPAGAVAVILFAVGSLLTGGRPGFDASAGELTDYLIEHRTTLQVGTAVLAAAIPFLIAFLATALWLGVTESQSARRLSRLALACWLVFLALFAVDITTIAVSALRPERIESVSELATTLRDLELLLMGTAAFLASAALLVTAGLILRGETLWPRWLGWAALGAGLVYLLRVGTLFTVDGPFAADGVLGLLVPVAALAGWILLASLSLTIQLRS